MWKYRLLALTILMLPVLAFIGVPILTKAQTYSSSQVQSTQSSFSTASTNMPQFCSGIPRVYNECIASNQSRTVLQDSCGNYQELSRQTDISCGSNGSGGNQNPAPTCVATSRQYPQCGGTVGLETSKGYNSANTYMVTEITDCSGNKSWPRDQVQDLGNRGQCQNPQPQPVIPTNGAPACDPNQVNMSISNGNPRVGETITFNVSGSQGSTWIDDQFSGGGPSNGGFWGSKSFVAQNPGTYTWTHLWKNTASNDTNATSPQCSKTGSFTIQQNSTPINPINPPFNPTSAICPNVNFVLSSSVTADGRPHVYMNVHTSGGANWSYVSLYEDGQILRSGRVVSNDHFAWELNSNNRGTHSYLFKVNDWPGYNMSWEGLTPTENCGSTLATI